MIENTFIPLNITSFHNYMLNKYNINIHDISIKEWEDMIHPNYCKNIIGNIFCFKKHKKNMLENNFCSKCCERKGIKRNNIYKKKKKQINIDNVNNLDDSGFYSELELNNDINDNILKTQHTNNKKVPMQNLDYEKNIDNNLINNRKFIKFGDLKFNLDTKYEYLMDKVQNLKSENKNKSHNINDNFITFGSLFFNNIKKINNSTLFFSSIEQNNKCSQRINIFEEEEKINLFNNDLYYIFIYLINLIFYNSDINFIKKELYFCLGPFGIDYYLS